MLTKEMINEIFAKQIETSNPLTRATLNKMSASANKICIVGDILLYFMVYTTDVIEMRRCTLRESEDVFKKYEFVEFRGDSITPVLRELDIE